MRWIRSMRTGFKNLFVWLPFIWRDRQYDQSFLLVMMAKKLKLMSEFNAYWSCNFPKEQKRMKIASLLAKRLVDCEYICNAPIDYECKFNEGSLDVKRILLPTCIGIYRDRNYEDILQRQDLDMLCEILKKRAFYWWD